MANIHSSRDPNTAIRRTRRSDRSVERSVWREQALIRADELETLLLRFEQGSQGRLVAPVADQIRRHLEAARAAAVGLERAPVRRLIGAANKDAVLERIGGNLDAAEAALLTIAPEPYVRGQVRVLVADVRRLSLGDVHRTVVEELARRPREQELSEADRSALVSAIQAANDHARRDLDRVRSLRNVLAVTTVLMTLLAIGLAILGFVQPTLIPLCYLPAGAVVCPTASAPVPFDVSGLDVENAVRSAVSRYDIAVVEITGLLGAVLAATLALRRFPGRSIPYNPVILLGLLKLPTGAITAVLGLILIRGQFIPGFAALDTSAQILAWAVVLGFGQQLFTRLVDAQALEVLTTVEAPGERESAGLDAQTAEAFTTAVSSTLRSSAPRALREAITGPPLVNYAGWVTLQILDATGRELDPPERRTVVLAPGTPYTLRVIIGQERRRGLPMALKVTEGVEEEIVRFGIDLDSNDRRIQQPQQLVTVGSSDGEAIVNFPLVVGDNVPSRWVWVRISQRERVVSQIEFEVRIPDRRA
jgi:hypothetical protein